MNTKKYILSGLIVAAIGIAGPFVMANTLEDALETTRVEYETLWDVAASTSERRKELEDVLSSFDQRVENAQVTLEELTNLRRVLREQISEENQRLSLLDQQLETLDNADTYYQVLSTRIRNTLADFARLIAIREVAADGGPGSSAFLLPLTSGSLGEHVDAALARDAVLRARATLLSQASIIAADSETTRESLKAAATRYSNQLAELEREQRRVQNEEYEVASFVDESWREKTLTTEELKQVAKEAKEASERVAAIQADLLEINEKLKKEKIDELTVTKDQAEKDMAGLNAEIDSLERRDTAMRLLEEAALRAYQYTVETRNSDRKLYQKIEIQKLHEMNAEEKREALLEEDPVNEEEVADVDHLLEVTREMLKLMNTGVTEDAAFDYVNKKLQATGATEERALIAASLSELRKKRSQVERQLSTAVAAIDSVEQQFSLSALPPIFLWPVKGIITAGYQDQDYVHVFKVQHNGMDIAVNQGTPVKSISDGIVHTVRDGGQTGYSYVLIGHRNGFASLYGHLSKILVREGDVVETGEVIALSGGIPGTYGAGQMTTGAHLHLEVTKDGVYVDPRSVLPE